MAELGFKHSRQVLIVSSHPLFGKGLQRLLQTRSQADARVVGIASSVEQAMAELERFNPDLVVVDYDDEAVNRDEFLARFVEGEKRLRVVLLSLKEGGSEAIVYDRRTLAASQIDVWLKEWTEVDEDMALLQRQGSIPPGKSLDNRRNNMKHAIGAFILVVALAAIGVVVLNNDLLLPTQASLQAIPIDNLFNLHFKLIAALFALIVGIMIYSVIFFRRKPGDLEDAAHIKGNNTLEVTWTIVPLGVVLAFAFLGSQALAETQRMDPRALEVRVVAQQWSWRFEYPQLNVISNELVLPVDRQVVLRLTSLDVIHSFWVPEFRVKQDALPGSERELRITPNQLGEYTLMCAEVCGTQHAYMTALVLVKSDADFNMWVEQELASIPDDPVLRGQRWYIQYGCSTCHSIDGSRMTGPTFLGAFGKEESFTDGTTRLVDEAYLFESIREPGKTIVEGFQNVMPATIADEMSDEQIADVIEFIKSLK